MAGETPIESTQQNLPFGYLSIGADGTVRKYSPFGAEAPVAAPEEIVGKNFFRDVVPPSIPVTLEKQFNAFVKGRVDEAFLSTQLQVNVANRTRKVHVGLVRSPLADEVILTISLVEHEDLPVSGQTFPNTVHGTLADATGTPVVVANTDYWHALEVGLRGLGQEVRHGVMHRLGLEWGLAHTVRVESFVQRENRETLREIELQLALEYLSGSLGATGLGRFEVSLDYRRFGLIVVDHRYSPFPSFLAGHQERCCEVLAGFHAGVFSYLSGRRLTAAELFCQPGGEERCRFIVAKDSRLASLFGEDGDAADRDLLAELKRLGRGRG